MRKYAEGTVFRRKGGRYVAQVRLENGKKKQSGKVIMTVVNPHEANSHSVKINIARKKRMVKRNEG